ncbi:hypothetical protein ES332_D04G118700v1 [Gossypium tomentosum]|uniref:Uncharacterized protein n=1 Tax=Gossypium tomentosum TaxID=34277 RepID=A0A5D2LCG7_GOSTO|nr:hypothetical protein ES332_D04G118700v1 [Gossypium tomentosum]
MVIVTTKKAHNFFLRQRSDRRSRSRGSYSALFLCLFKERFTCHISGSINPELQRSRSRPVLGHPTNRRRGRVMVDPTNTPLGKMLLEEITPVVMVLCTPLVEESCLKNGLSFVQMLSPFCDFTNIDVPVRTASDQPYRLHKFKFRLFYASDIRQPNLEVAKERLKQVITKAGEDDFPEIYSDLPQVNDLLSRHESEILPTWFQFFNKELVRTLSFSDHEAFDHPVACLLVVSSRDEEPINRFIDLFNTNKLPSFLSDGAMDPKVLKHYLLVHDNQDGASEKYATPSYLSMVEIIKFDKHDKMLLILLSNFIRTCMPI